MSAVVLFAFLLQTAAPPQAGNQTPAQPTLAPPAQPTNTTPGQPGAPPGVDPAAAVFTSPGGLLLVSVKPDKVADYEAAIRALQAQLANASDEKHRAIAQGWRVYKAAELDAKANALYVHLLQPAVPQVDYRPSLLLDELLSGASAELLGKYRDAIASPPIKIGLTEFANMTVAPVSGNESPKGPVPPKKPGC